VYILERLAEDLAYSDSVAGNPKAPSELLARLTWNQDGNSHTRSTVRALGCATTTGRNMHEGQARLAAAYLGVKGWET
jgi:hypothetical protein